jgi:hypothetical protein
VEGFFEQATTSLIGFINCFGVGAKKIGESAGCGFQGMPVL